MRMKKSVENRTLKSAAAEFIAFKRAQKIRERTLNDYQKYINPFVEQSSNSMDIDVLKREILEYFANIPATSPARYNHPYQYRLIPEQEFILHRYELPYLRTGFVLFMGGTGFCSFPVRTAVPAFSGLPDYSLPR